MRMLPASTIAPIGKGSLWERLLIAQHFTPVNDIKCPSMRRKGMGRFWLALAGYALVMVSFVLALVAWS